MGDLSNLARSLNVFKAIVETHEHIQYSVMLLKPGENIGLERHAGYDQGVWCVDGTGLVRRNEEYTSIGPASLVGIRGGVLHDVTNTSPDEVLRLVVSYSPPKFPRDTVFRTKADAERYDREQETIASSSAK